MSEKDEKGIDENTNPKETDGDDKGVSSEFIRAFIGSKKLDGSREEDDGYVEVDTRYVRNLGSKDRDKPKLMGIALAVVAVIVIACVGLDISVQGVIDAMRPVVSAVLRFFLKLLSVLIC